VLAFLTDENFNGRIMRGVRRRRPDLDIVRVQDVGLSGADDPAVLEWAARFGRIVLTHSVIKRAHGSHAVWVRRQTVPMVEAMVALVLVDHYLRQRAIAGDAVDSGEI
jgi:predicted nuclease of predicted toxin-antitoxin system